MHRTILGIVLLAVCAGLAGTPVRAAGKSFRLAAAGELVANGALRYLLPRFSLKTGVRIELVTLDEAPGADAALAAFTAPPEATEVVAVFRHLGDGRRFSLAIYPTAARPQAERLRDWLISKIGLRAVGKFRPDGEPVYGEIPAAPVVEVAAAPTGDTARGGEIALGRCGRCHVIDDRNRFGGIDSTPSFGALRTLPHWRERFEAFWTLNPHPAFTQVVGVTEPFDRARPPPIAPLVLTQAEIDAILAFVIAMKPKDLGAALVVQ